MTAVLSPAAAGARAPTPASKGPVQAGTASVAPPVEREFELTAGDFERVRVLIYQRAGIALQTGKEAMVYSRLSRLVRETGHRSFTSYLSALEAGTGPAAEASWQVFVNGLTTNLTSFFREAHHFPVLAEALLKQRALRAEQRQDPTQRIWCCAASTGEEPYSLAMTVAETLGPQHGTQILASDIDTAVLATAERGIYPATAQGLSPERLRAHCLRGTGAHSGSIRIRPELARSVSFRPFNLIGSHWDLGDAFDIVFCRNVMIYFDAATQRRVLECIHRAMRPGGLLFVGHSENFSDARSLFALRGKTVYERLAN